MRKRHQVILHLGSNKGNRMLNLQQARWHIAQRIGTIIRASKLFDTEPWGKEDQARFLNQALWVSTTFSPLKLLDMVQEIEISLGRKRLEKWGTRIIDIDIIFYSNKIIATDRLQVPHPLMQERNFVLQPVNEIATKWKHPILQKTVAQLALECKDERKVNFS